MSKKFGDLLSDLLQKAGLDHTDKQFSELLSIQAEVSREVADSFDGLMSIDAAKNNTTIKNYFYAMAYSGSDRKMLDLAEKFGFPDDQKLQLKEEKSSGKKYDLFGRFLEDKVADLEKEYKAAQRSGNTDEMKSAKDEIAKLNESLRSKDDEIRNVSSSKDQALKDYILNAKIESAFSNISWSENYKPEIRGDLSKIALNKELDKIGAKIVLNENNEPRLVKKDNPELEYFDSSNKEIKFTELATRVAVENKFLAVSPKMPNNNPNPVAPVSGNQPNTSKRNTVSNLLKESLKDQQG